MCMKMKNWIYHKSAILVLLLWAQMGCLSGCSGKQDNLSDEWLTEEQTPEEPAQTQEPATDEVLPEPAEELYGPVEVSQLDYDSFRSRMTTEEWEGFEQYFPVLKENASFELTDRGDYIMLNKDAEAAGADEKVMFYRYTSDEVMSIDNFTSSYAVHDIERILIKEVRVFDLDGDGTRELILEWTPVGDYLILHRENDRFYAWKTVYRGFESLQTNGIYIGSSGAGSNLWMRLRFENGSWLEEILADEDWGEYWLNGEAVDEDTFFRQVNAYATGDVTGYKPKGCAD